MHVRGHICQPAIARLAGHVLHLRHSQLHVGRKAKLILTEHLRVGRRIAQDLCRMEVFLNDAAPALLLVVEGAHVVLHQKPQADACSEESIEGTLQVAHLLLLRGATTAAADWVFDAARTC